MASDADIQRLLDNVQGYREFAQLAQAEATYRN